MNEQDEIPAELCMSNPHRTNNWNWVGQYVSLMQIGVYSAGTAGSHKQAYVDGSTALCKVHRQQQLML